MAEYVTSEEHVPESIDKEITLQVTNKETKVISTVRGKLTQDPTVFEETEPLTILRGPHENVKEQWYIEVIESDVTNKEIDEELLRHCIRKTQEESNIVNTRSDGIKALLLYLVAVDDHESVSGAVRKILIDYINSQHPELFETYLDVNAEYERENLLQSYRRSL